MKRIIITMLVVAVGAGSYGASCVYYDNCKKLCYTQGNYDTRTDYVWGSPPVGDLDCISIIMKQGGSWVDCPGCITGTFNIVPSAIWNTYSAYATTNQGEDAIIILVVSYEKTYLWGLYPCEWEYKTEYRIKGPGGPNLTVPDYCEDDAIDGLTSYTNVPGGTWSGPGVSGISFNPAAAPVGPVGLTYNVIYPTFNNCSVNNSEVITINALPNPTVQQAFPTGVNVLDGSIDLRYYFNPFGLQYSGVGVGGTGNWMLNYCDAGVGIHTITATWNDANGCTGMVSQDITIGGVTTFNLPFADSLATADGSINLYDYTGTTSGGTFSGNGVWGGSIFSPLNAGVGTHLITYTLCGQVDTQSVTVVGDPGIPDPPALVEGVIFYSEDGGYGGGYKGRVCLGDTVHFEVDYPDTLGLTYIWYDETNTVIGTGYMMDYVVTTINPQGVSYFYVEAENWVFNTGIQAFSLETFVGPALHLIDNNPDTICVKDTIKLDVSFVPVLYYDFTYDTIAVGQHGPYATYDTMVMQVRKFVWFDDLGNILDTVSTNDFDTIYETITKTSYIAVNNGPVAACMPTVDTTISLGSIFQVTFANAQVWNLTDPYDRTEKNYTCQYVANVEKGEVVWLDVNTVDNYDFGVWIDYNNDGSFAVSELVVSVTNSGGFSQSFTIPTTATTNSLLRMRIIAETINPITGACMNSQYGTIQDYGVLVSDTGLVSDSIFTGTPKITCGLVKFTETSSDYVNGMFWDFGDGNTSTVRNPEHIYTTTGNYTVTLTRELLVPKDSVATFSYVLTDERRVLYVQTLDDYSSDPYVCHCAASGLDSIVLNKSPDIDFSLSDSSGCEPLLVWVNDQSSFVDQYMWLMGNGDTDSVAAPIVTYVNDGVLDTVYNVQLNATSLYGCMDMFSIPVVVYAKPSAGFTFSPTSGCSPLEVAFVDTSDIGVSFYWDFGDGNTGDSLGTVFSHMYNEYDSLGEYKKIKLEVMTNWGCRDTIVDSVWVFPVLIADFMTLNDTVVAPGDLVQFQNTSYLGNTFEWDFGDNVISYDEDPWHYFNIPGMFDVRLIITNQYGCKDTVIRNSYITVTEQVGIKEGIMSKINVYPNPIGEKFTIDLGTDNIGKGRMYLQDLSGKRVYALKLDGSRVYEINVEGVIERGIYLLNVEIEGEGKAIYKIVKL